MLFAFLCTALTIVIDQGDVSWYRWFLVTAMAGLVAAESVKLYRLRRRDR